MSIAYVLSSIIMMTTLGLAVGNYATSITFRLPRGLKIANDPPYCDSCRQYLAPRDLVPFFSWLVNKARCRFCAAPVPALYAFVELACAVVFNFAWFAWWPQAIDVFFTTIGLGVFVVTLISLHVAEKRLFPIVVILVAGFGLVNRVLFDHGIFGFVTGGAAGTALGIAGWGFQCLLARRRLPFPDYAILAGIAGACIGRDPAGQFNLVIVALILMIVFWLIGRRSETVRGSEGVLAITLTLLAISLQILPSQIRMPGDNPISCNKYGCNRG